MSYNDKYKRQREALLQDLSSHVVCCESRKLNISHKFESLSAGCSTKRVCDPTLSTAHPAHGHKWFDEVYCSVSAGIHAPHLQWYIPPSCSVTEFKYYDRIKTTPFMFNVIYRRTRRPSRWWCANCGSWQGRGAIACLSVAGGSIVFSTTAVNPEQMLKN